MKGKAGGLLISYFRTGDELEDEVLLLWKLHSHWHGCPPMTLHIPKGMAILLVHQWRCELPVCTSLSKFT